MTDERLHTRCDRVQWLMAWAQDADDCPSSVQVSEHVDLDADQQADVDLTNALLAVEREVMDRQWQALEALLPLIPPGGDISEVLHLPRPQALRAARLALDCGWL